MAELVSIYAGQKKLGILRKKALESEATRQGPNVSVSEIVWAILKKSGSAQLRADLEAAEKADKK